MSDDVERVCAGLEAAIGPDRELDCLIYEALGYEVTRAHGRMRRAKRGNGPLRYQNGSHWSYLNRMTASIDDAMKLVPAAYRLGTLIELESAGPRWAAKLFNRGRPGGLPSSGGATAPLALCAAALRAHLASRP